jgi:hypothetical protein
VALSFWQHRPPQRPYRASGLVLWRKAVVQQQDLQSRVRNYTDISIHLNPCRGAYAIVARMRLISANASFFSEGVISEAWIPLRTIVTISSR